MKKLMLVAADVAAGMLQAANGGAALDETTTFAAAESVWPAGLEKTVTVRPTDVDLGYCGVTLPVSGAELVYDWKVVNGKRETAFRAPPGWRLK